mgnify:CR=1 FL=1|tara:strand:- start:26651 stop:26953 length:303 start_codon:yes stop_codon:yes gene_type:complete
MDTIADFISKDDEIVRLNTQINMVSGFYKNLYESEILKLKRRISTLSDGSSIYRTTRKNDAIKMIKKLKGTGRPGEVIKHIASEVYLSEKRVSTLWYAVK